MTKFEEKSMIYLLAKPLFLGFGLMFILRLAGGYAWLSVILGSLIGLGLNFLLTKVIKKLPSLISLTLNIVLLIGGGLLLIPMIQRIYLDQTPYWFIIIPLFLLIFYTLKKKRETVYRVTSLLVILEVLLLVIAVVSLVPMISISNFTVLGEFRWLDLIYGALVFAVLSTTPYLLINDFAQKYHYKAYLKACLVLLSITLLIIGVLSPDVALLFRYPDYVLFKTVHFFGFLENIENIIFTIWVMAYFPYIMLASHNIKKIISK